ncbi:MAG TPA: EpsI family protein [Aquabacterium sp.]|nr:EpsI family protein [Aquabacterium sp.]
MSDWIKRFSWPVVLGVALMAGAVAAGVLLRPSHFWSDAQGQLNLERMVPKQFGHWRTLEVQKLQVVDPTVEETLKTLYSQTLNRLYEDDEGHQIMVSLAYGVNQSSWNTAAHRPEFCYSGQGFDVAPKGIRDIGLSNHDIEAVNFVGTRQDRVEAVTYWVTLADSVALPGWRRKLQQLKYGLQGYIVDGMLVRVSSLGSNESVQFEVQEKFVKDLEQAISRDIRPRFFGH